MIGIVRNLQLARRLRDLAAPGGNFDVFICHAVLLYMVCEDCNIRVFSHASDDCPVTARMSGQTVHPLDNRGHLHTICPDMHDNSAIQAGSLPRCNGAAAQISVRTESRF